MKRNRVLLLMVMSFVALCVTGSLLSPASGRQGASGAPAVLFQPTPHGGSKAPDVVFVPTPHAVVDIMLRLADIGEGDVVYDLGSGDGRIVIAAAEKYGVKCVGVEIDPAMVHSSRQAVRSRNLEHLVTIVEADIFKLDFSDATVVTLYLGPELNVRLIPQLEKLNPGSRIVSHDFDIKGVLPDVEALVYRGDGFHSTVYLWTAPLKKRLGEASP